MCVSHGISISLLGKKKKICLTGVFCCETLIVDTFISVTSMQKKRHVIDSVFLLISPNFMLQLNYFYSDGVVFTAAGGRCE